ncbi:uncharacterized protein LOC135226297 [Macrobrachium nipponense]|uniref:uncharacterized protein LOC135226297 n=1 Tax=Macrobrachium nipponense TaxID=159736 RepID=UPI0030C8B2E8
MPTKVITAVGETENFAVSVGLHQGSALRPLLFVLVMDVLSEAIRNEELWELLYADDLVIIAENEEDLQRRVGEWHESLERWLKDRVTELDTPMASDSEEIRWIDRIRAITFREARDAGTSCISRSWMSENIGRPEEEQAVSHVPHFAQNSFTAEYLIRMCFVCWDHHFDDISLRFGKCN